MGVEFFSLTSLLAMAMLDMPPGARTPIARLAWDIANEENQ